jgi:dTDP-4-dehydrorhamnose reductase
MKVLVIGGTGMLGHKLVQTLDETCETWSTIRGSYEDIAHTGIFDQERTIENMNVRDFSALEGVIQQIEPDVVINAVGIIKQVPASKDIVDLITINSILPHMIAKMSENHGFRSICISTDCVFSGTKGLYRENDPADAVDVYGKSKHLGEVDAANCLTLRTSIIGRELWSSHSLIEWFLSQPEGPVRGFSRAIYSGFPTIVLSEIISDIILRHGDVQGVLHVSSEPISKLDLLRLVNDAFGGGHEIIADDDVVIDRSLDSTRFRELTGFKPMPWPKMIHRLASDPTKYQDFRSHDREVELSRDRSTLFQRSVEC